MPPSIMPLKSWLQPIADNLSSLFAFNEEPMVTQRVDQAGSLTWHIYNPHTKTLIEFASEREMLEWLDRHPIT